MEFPKISWPKVVLFGDSLTQKSFEPSNGLWGALLADRLQRIADVVVRGFSGYNTAMCQVILPSLFYEDNIHDVHAFVICLGANDSNSPESSTKQHVPLSEFQKNIASMIKYLMSIGVSANKIILMTPPPYHHESYVSHCQKQGLSEPVKSNDDVMQYAEECKRVCKEHSVDVVDLYSEMMKDQDWPSYLIDGLHFSHTGSVKVFTLLWPHIEKRTDSKKLIFPFWKDISPTSPEKSLCEYLSSL